MTGAETENMGKLRKSNQAIHARSLNALWGGGRLRKPPFMLGVFYEKKGGWEFLQLGEGGYFYGKRFRRKKIRGEESSYTLALPPNKRAMARNSIRQDASNLKLLSIRKKEVAWLDDTRKRKGRGVSPVGKGRSYHQNKEKGG